jgi:prephenate dehydrogenase
MGGSLGLALQAAGYTGRLLALTRDPSDVQAAIDAGAVQAGVTRVEDLPDGIGLYCLAVPLSAVTCVLKQLAPRLDNPRVVVTDVGSVKVPVVNAAAGIMPHPGSFVGGHPMAGFRHRGVTFARADLFHGATAILTPVSATRPEALACVRSMWEAVRANVTTMSPRQHDEVVARVSQLPHAVAALLMLEAARDDGLKVASKGLLDVTRIAARDADLWHDTLVCNRDQVRDAISRFIAELRRLDRWLERHEDENVHRLLTRAVQIRDKWVAEKFERPGWID